MEKFTLFDLLSFILPGALCLQFLYWLNARGGDYFSEDLIITNDIISVMVLLFVTYLLGLVLNHIRLNFKIFWARKSNSYIEPLRDNMVWLEVLDRTSQRYLGSSLLDDNELSPQVAERLFNLSFELLGQEAKMDRTSSVRLQAFFLENTKTLFVITGIVWVLLTLGNIFHFPGVIWQGGSIMQDIIGSIGCLALAYGCHFIARQRWRNFYHSIWQNFYAYHLHHQLSSTKNK